MGEDGACFVLSLLFDYVILDSSGKEVASTVNSSILQPPDRIIKFENKTFMFWDKRERLLKNTIPLLRHQIGNALNTIHSSLEVIIDLIYQSEKEEIKTRLFRVLEKVEEAGDILKLIRKIEKDIEQLEIKPLPVKMVVEEFIKGEGMGYRDVEIEMNLEDGICMGEENMLKEVLRNVITNAVESYKDYERKKWVYIGGRNLHGYYELTVEDRGRGMDSEDLSQIFEPFWTTKKGEGRGWGMSIAKLFVELMGGRITIESQKNIGTKVHITLVSPWDNEN